MARFLAPLIIFIAVLGLLWVGLGLNPREVPSPLIGKPAPEFTLPGVNQPDRMLSRQSLLGSVYLLNVWASWCVSCREEHPLLVQLSRTHQVPIYGLNYKDTRADALRWLSVLGDPYEESAFDENGRVGFDWGVYGVPETFVIDRDGIIRHKHIGPVTRQDLEAEILPLIRQLQNGEPS